MTYHIFQDFLLFVNMEDLIGVVRVSALISNVVDSGFEYHSEQTKNYEIGMYCFSDKNAAVRRTSNDFLVPNQNNVSEFQGDMSIQIQVSLYSCFTVNGKYVNNCIRCCA
jgi:hypothetical protein